MMTIRSLFTRNPSTASVHDTTQSLDTNRTQLTINTSAFPQTEKSSKNLSLNDLSETNRKTIPKACLPISPAKLEEALQKWVLDAEEGECRTLAMNSILNFHNNYQIKNPFIPKNTKLDLSDFQLKNLPDCLGELNMITELNLSGNQLTEIPDYFDQFSNLEKLDISNNLLSSIPKKLKIHTLIELDIKNNKIQHIDLEFLENLPNIQYLNLKNNLIKTVTLTTTENRFTPSNTLHYLDLSNNQIDSMPLELNKLSNLKTLLLHKNQLSQIPQNNNIFSKLKILFLNNNPLQELLISPNQFPSLIQLKLSETQLNTLPKQIDTLKKLKILDLQSTPLQHLPIELKKFWEQRQFQHEILISQGSFFPPYVHLTPEKPLIQSFGHLPYKNDTPTIKKNQPIIRWELLRLQEKINLENKKTLEQFNRIHTTDLSKTWGSSETLKAWYSSDNSEASSLETEPIKQKS